MSTAPTLIGTYTAPGVRKGERVTCLYRDAECVVTGFTAAPIPWPRVQPVEHRGGSGLWVCAELERAIRTESALALMHWFGVTAGVVWKWRKLFGVNGHATTEGSKAANRAVSVKGAAANGRVWTDEELALLGSASDRVIGERIGRCRDSVAVKRRAMGIAAYQARAKRKGGA